MGSITARDGVIFLGDRVIGTSYIDYTVGRGKAFVEVLGRRTELDLSSPFLSSEFNEFVEDTLNIPKLPRWLGRARYGNEYQELVIQASKVGC